MHAFAMHREPVVPPTHRLRALLDEQGGRRRLLEAVEERLGELALRLDDEQLLLRASALLEDHRLGELAL